MSSTFPLSVLASDLSPFPRLKICISNRSDHYWVWLHPPFMYLSNQRANLVYWSLSQIQFSTHDLPLISCPLQEEVLTGQCVALEFPLATEPSDEQLNVRVETDNDELQKVIEIKQQNNSLVLKMDLRSSQWLSNELKSHQLHLTVDRTDQKSFHVSLPISLRSPFSLTATTYPHKYCPTSSAPIVEPSQEITTLLDTLHLPIPSIPFPTPSCFLATSPSSSLQTVIAGYWFTVDLCLQASDPMRVHSITLTHPQNAFSRCFLVNPIVSDGLHMDPNTSVTWSFSLAIADEWIGKEIEGASVDLVYSLFG